ncbi:MAG TPA: tetratricopeptide repeat protein [Pyrinomonadaceae bacterium]|nr:tetratricopeptide repeat protein [Pyrinomonadaceae bacterium]
MAARKITNEGFVDEFLTRHEQMSDRPFCWVLGSGASVQSGIPTGSVLVEQWLKELHRLEDFSRSTIEQWATADVLEIPGFEYARAANFYPWVYHRRFRDYKEQGYAFLEKAMEKAEPSFGYSVLAQIMTHTQHKTAITTNFDNLIADALSIYTKTFPLVCGHESLTGYIRANLRRPLVAKIHRDLLLAPLSNPDEIAKLPGEWAAALKKILDRFTPIVIGYGGNDGSLMGFLRDLEPIEGGIFWCYRGEGEVEPNVQDIVEKHKGRLVPILGFDELMLQLQEKLELPILLPQLQSTHDARVANYRKQFETLNASLEKLSETPLAEEVREPVRKAAAAAFERLTTEKDWWAWQLKAYAEPDPDMKEEIFRRGLEEFPKSAQLTGEFAIFMMDVRRDYDEAERLYRRALELDPINAVATGNLAFFMWEARKNYDQAERLFREALQLSPNNVAVLENFAEFLGSRNRIVEGRSVALRAALLLDNIPTRNHAYVAFICWLFDRALGMDGSAALGRLRTVLETGFERSPYAVTFDQSLQTLVPQIPEEERALAQKLADAILDETKVGVLESEPLWKKVKPIPLTTPWPNDFN